MRIALLHHDLEKSEEMMAADLRSAGIVTDMFDIRSVELPQLDSHSLVLNRVYASVATRDLDSLSHCQVLVKGIEERGQKCINGYNATRADYDKYYSYELLKKAGVPTPPTELLAVDDFHSIQRVLLDFASLHGFPFILKRNSSGRGVGLYKVDEVDQIDGVIHQLMNDEAYTGKWVVQAFVKSVRPYDWRPYIVCGKVACSATRSLIKTSEDDAYPWLGSVARGSHWGDVPPTPEEAEVALRAALAIGAEINTPDIVFGENGPVIIENNPTPRFFETEGKPDDRYQSFMKVFVPYLLESFK